MTDPGSSETAETAAHSAGEPDADTSRDEASRTGSDVGGPATTSESATEDAVVGGGTSSAGSEDEQDDQAKNPL